MGTVIEPIAKFAAGKKFALGEKRYNPGEPVDTSNLPAHKIKQFLRQRLLVPNLEQTEPVTKRN